MSDRATGQEWEVGENGAAGETFHFNANNMYISIYYAVYTGMYAFSIGIAM